MTRSESLDIVQMIVNHWQVRDWTEDQIDAYAKSIQWMDAEVATSVVLRAVKTVTYAPKIAEFTELYGAERRLLRPTMPVKQPTRTPMPLWVRRWMCARLLYERWGKPRDDRRFPEQGDFGDLTVEMMPEGAWQAEAESLSEKEFVKAFQRMNRT